MKKQKEPRRTRKVISKIVGSVRRAMPTREGFKRIAPNALAVASLGVGLWGAHAVGVKFEAHSPLSRMTPRQIERNLKEMEGRLKTPTASDLERVLGPVAVAKLKKIIYPMQTAIFQASFSGEETEFLKKYAKAMGDGERGVWNGTGFWSLTPEKLYAFLSPEQREEWEGFISEYKPQFNAFAANTLTAIPTKDKTDARFRERLGNATGGFGSAFLFYLTMRAILRKKRLYPSKRS